MGEAKHRTENEANFGKIPKDRSPRGLIVSPPLEINGSRMLIKKAGIDPQELRFALLFWDKLVWPSSRAVHIGSGPDEKFLESTGVLVRPDYTFNGDGAQGIVKSHFAAFDDRDKAEPGRWAMSQGSNSFMLLGDHQKPDAGAVLELHRAIPIPASSVPLNEILEFKERRKDELWLLRNKIDLFVAAISASSDPDAMLEAQILEIDKACADLLSIGREWQFPVHLSNLKTSFSLTAGKFFPAANLGWLAGKEYGLTAAAAAAGAAGLASTLELKADFGLRNIRKPASPYKYAFHIENELR